MPEDHFGEEIAARYDDPSDEMFQAAAIEPVVDFLAALADDGAAVELGIGTGRIALPLPQRGVEVHGIDLSSAMVARLRAKPGGDKIPVAIGDFATARADGAFSLAYLVFNTINNLITQDAQVACFEHVAAHLEPGGHFVIEVGVPQLQRLPARRNHTDVLANPHPPGLRRVSTSPSRASSRTTTSSSTAYGGPTRSRSATSGRPSSI
jgi:SAM-dependent methyltransferase